MRLGADAVSAVSLPSPSPPACPTGTLRSEARTLGVDYHLLPIPAFDAFLHARTAVRGPAAGHHRGNIQARCRGVLLMALSNKTGRLVLTTSSKSETAVGYSTLYGDMAGGFAPIGTYRRRWSTGWLRGATARRRRPSSAAGHRPAAVRGAAPRPDRPDSLPPYDVLDAILGPYAVERRDRSVEELVADGFERHRRMRRAAGDPSTNTSAGRRPRACITPARLRPVTGAIRSRPGSGLTGPQAAISNQQQPVHNYMGRRRSMGMSGGFRDEPGSEPGAGHAICRRHAVAAAGGGGPCRQRSGACARRRCLPKPGRIRACRPICWSAGASARPSARPATAPAGESTRADYPDLPGSR